MNKKTARDAAIPVNDPRLYRKEPKIYPREAKGRFAKLRKLAVWVLLGLFYVVCWLQWDGQQAVLFDLPARKFHIFGLTLWPQDFIYLTGLLIVAGLSLFFFTALAGRLWCGFACPADGVDRSIHHDRAAGPRVTVNKRMKLDKAPWTGREKLLRKGVPEAGAVDDCSPLWTGFTFVGFFTPILRNWPAMSSTWSKLGGWESFLDDLLRASLPTVMPAMLREQVCKYMCPYARFQSRDVRQGHPDHLLRRGTWRAARRHGARVNDAAGSAEPRRSCINCTLCVQVCPTGIDIRDGLQYECIACAACIDVCDQVMDKMDYPQGPDSLHHGTCRSR